MQGPAAVLLSLQHRCQAATLKSTSTPTALACPPQNGVCVNTGPGSHSTCHFNRYLRHAIVDLNGDFGGQCQRGAFATVEDWRKCKEMTFDLYYDMSRYVFKGDCSKQTLRYLRVGAYDVFCGAAATEDLRTFPLELLDICHPMPGYNCSIPRPQTTHTTPTHPNSSTSRSTLSGAPYAGADREEAAAAAAAAAEVRDALRGSTRMVLANIELARRQAVFNVLQVSLSLSLSLSLSRARALSLSVRVVQVTFVSLSLSLWHR
jgi:hypothetical protein